MTDPAARTTAAARPLGAASVSTAVHDRLLWAAGVLLGVWVAALAMLALTTANPPQVNLAQLSRATLLVTARVVDRDTGECAVIRSFSPGPTPERLVVTDLAETPAQVETAYLFPLVRDVAGPEGAYRIVAVPDLEIPPLIYPAGPEIDSQVESWQRPRR